MRHFACHLCASLAVAARGCTVRHPHPHLAGQDVRLRRPHRRPPLAASSPTTSPPGRSTRARPGAQAADIAVVGGIGRISTVVKCIRGIRAACDGSSRHRTVGARSIHLDSATSSRARRSSTSSTARSRCAPCRDRLTAMALGNHEFDQGAVNLELAVSEVRRSFPILAANYSFADPNDSDAAQAAQRHPAVRRSSTSTGCKVGIIGMGNLSSIAGHHRGRQLARRPPDRRDQAIPTRSSAAAPAGRRARRGLAPRPRRGRGRRRRRRVARSERRGRRSTAST